MARLEFGPIEPLGLDDFDAPADVDAAARTQRRLATGYASVFVLLVFAGPVLSVTLPWWSRARLIGGMSPNFVTVAIGLYLVFLFLAVAAASLARTVEGRMLGVSGDEEELR